MPIFNERQTDKQGGVGILTVGNFFVCDMQWKLVEEQLVIAVCELYEIYNCLLNSYWDINRAYAWQNIDLRLDELGNVMYSFNVS